MHMTRNKQTIEVVAVSQELRRRRSAEVQTSLVRETYEPGMTVSSVLCKPFSVQASCLNSAS